MAILTPTASADEEESRQDVARVFIEAIQRKRPDIHVIALTQTLSAINAAGLAKPYEEMYATYHSTGLFDVQLLRKIGQATGTHLLLQLKLTGFQQDTKDGLSFFGLTFTHRETADAHLLGQIWDSSTGRIIWEKAGSASKSSRSVKNKAIPLVDVVRAAAEDLVGQLPD